VTEQALSEDVALDDLQTEFSGLNLQIDTVVFVAQEPPRKPFTGRNPYRGLRKFTEDEAEFFFGRTAAIQSLLDTVQYLVDAETSREVPDLVAVLGPSGSGKSSLVRAGLIPALRQGRINGSDQWPIRVMVPGAHPLDALAAQFVEPTGRGLPVLRADLDSGEQALHQLMLESLVDKPDDAVFVLVIDQFEELFTLCENEAERQAFLAHLLHVSQTRHNRGFIILTMRADFYSKVAQYKNLAEVITTNQMLVSPLTERELREAILLPAEAVGLELEKALVESLLNDTADAPGVLPLLQHTLLELFERRNGNLLTLEAYQEIGGVKGALAHRADATLEALPTEQQQMARRIFLRLIQPGEGTLDTRRRTTFDEVLTQTTHPDTVEAIVQTLANANLLITGHNPDTGEVVLDVSHEALIQEWPQLRRWLDEDRRGFRIHRQLSQAVRQWAERGRDNDSLYRGARLLEVEEWLDANPDEVNPSEAEFITASQSARERSRRRTRLVIAGLAVGLVIAVLGAIFGWFGQQQAQTEAENARNAEATAEQRRVTAEAAEAQAQAESTRANEQADIAQTAQAEAEEKQAAAEAAEATAQAERDRAEEQARIAQARQLATQAQTALDGDWPQRSLLLAAEAIQAHHPRLPAAEQALRDALQKTGGLPLSGHEGPIYAVAFSPDGQWLVTGGEDGMARLWNMAESEAEPVVLAGHEDPIYAVAFSPDGQGLVTGGVDGTARLWNMAEPEAEPVVLAGHEGGIRAVAFSPDGQWLVTGSDDTTARLWNMAESEAEPVVLAGHEGGIRAVAFSPDGQWLVTGSNDTTARLWNMADPEAEPVVLAGHEDEIRTVAFSPDGQWLVTGSWDHTARRWNMAEPETEPVVLAGHADAIIAVAFSPDGQWLVTGSADATARLWSIAGPEAEPVVLAGHEGEIRAVAFSPDGQGLVTGSWDHTARLWNMADPEAEPVVLAGHEDPIYAVAFSPDGQWLVTGSDDGTARLWNIKLDALLAQACQTTGRNLSLDEWQRYFPGETYRRTCPEWPIHPTFINAARNLARQGKVEAAVVQFEHFLELDPTLDLDPPTEAQQVLQAAVANLLEEGTTLAREGRVSQAATKFQQALKLDPGLPFTDPQAEAKRLAQDTAENLVGDGLRLAGQGEIESALAKFDEAAAIGEIPAEAWHTLCFKGGQLGPLKRS
jgi:WD40 repeat protein/energy-coupling factor transporter ATP-binding protein EcfA2